MPRHRLTLALILICLSILATVITAFRIRDLPKTIQEPKNYESKKQQQKCDNCDVKDNVKFVPKLHSVKIESVKRSYEDIKKQSPDTKFRYKIEDDDDDDDDDSDLPLSDSISVAQKILKSEDSLRLKPEASQKFLISNKNKDENDDEDNGKSGDVKKHTKKVLKTSENKLPIFNIKELPKETIPLSKLKRKAFIIDSDSDDDKDDDGNNADTLKIKSNSKEHQIKPIVSTSTAKDSLSDKKTLEKIRKNESDSVKIITLQEDQEIIPKIISGKETTNKVLDTSNTEDNKKKIGEDSSDSESKRNDKNQNSQGNSNKLTEKQVVNIDEYDDEDDDDDDDDDFVISINIPPKILDKIENKPKFKATPVEKKSDDLISHKELKQDHPKDEVENKKVKETNAIVTEREKEAVPPKNNKEPKTTGKQKIENEDKVSKFEKSKLKRLIPNDKIENNLQEAKDIIKPTSKKDGKQIGDFKKSEIKITEEKKNVVKTRGILKKAEKEHENDKFSRESLEEKQENHSQTRFAHVTDALIRRNLLQSEFEDFYAFFPTFAPNFSRIHNSECRRHGQILLRQLRGTKLWALNMLDATAKIPSGILQGNGIQLGNFDQCMAVRARVQLDTGSVVKIQGKYCLARLDLKAEHPELEMPVYLAQAKNLLKSRIDDPGHFAPRFSTLSWGLCVPSACNHEDVEVVVKDALMHYQHTSGVVIRVKVDEQDCHTYNTGDQWQIWLELPTAVTLSLYAVIVLLVTAATIQDAFADPKPDGQNVDETDEKAECDQKKIDALAEKADEKPSPDGFLSGFSLYRTVPKLLAPADNEKISCIHGVRGLATLALLVAHKFVSVGATPYTNRLKLTETASSPIFYWLRAGWVYTDCFLLLSGTLTAHRIALDSDAGALKQFLSKYLRLTPALLAVVLFYAYIWENISSGPMWGSLVMKNAEVCKEGWWWNLLYVQNYFGFDEICAPQTHQLALDMQLTLLGGVIVWMWRVRPGATKLALLGVHLLAACSRYTTVYEHRLSLLVYHGISLSQLYRTARLSYSSVLHRCTAYLIGITLGLALETPRKHNKFLVILGWSVSIALVGALWWAGYDSGYTQYRYDASFAAQYSALAPIASAVSIAWIIYAVHTGLCEFLSRLLCSRPLVLLSRLSYALYLCQFVVYLSHTATLRSSREFNLNNVMDFQEVLALLMISLILTLTLILPMQSLPKVFSLILQSESKIESEKNGETEATGEENIAESENSAGEFPPKVWNRKSLLVHREVLEEIPEAEIELEMQRERSEGLEEILEEEEDETINEELDNELEEPEIIDEEIKRDDDYWTDRDPDSRRPNQADDDRDLDEWEWTADGNVRNGAQYYRYNR